jgi:hypothetical protein
MAADDGAGSVRRRARPAAMRPSKADRPERRALEALTPFVVGISARISCAGKRQRHQHLAQPLPLDSARGQRAEQPGDGAPDDVNL